MVQVPLVDAVAHEAERGPAPSVQGNDKIALLVENDADLRRALVLLLESWGMSVLEAGSGEEALALIDELGILPDLCLVDHQLGDGLTGIAAIRALWARHGAIPARLITANRSRDVQDQARAAGIAVLMKPIDARALQGFIAQVGAQATTMV